MQQKAPINWHHRLRRRGWKKLSQIPEWTYHEGLEIYHPSWGFITRLHPSDRFGLDPEEVWGYIHPR